MCIAHRTERRFSPKALEIATRTRDCAWRIPRGSGLPRCPRHSQPHWWHTLSARSNWSGINLFGKFWERTSGWWTTSAQRRRQSETSWHTRWVCQPSWEPQSELLTRAGRICVWSKLLKHSISPVYLYLRRYRSFLMHHYMYWTGVSVRC